MPYSADKPTRARSSEELRAAIPGWGADTPAVQIAEHAVRTRYGITGLGFGATRFAADVMLDRWRENRHRPLDSRWCASARTRSRPSRWRKSASNTTRWSLNRVDHNE